MPEKGMRKCIFAAAAAVAVLLSDIGGTAVYAGENVPYETYNYDYYEDIKYTPAAYVPDGTVTGDVIGCGNFSSPQDLNTDADGNVYIADTGNNRIVVTDSDFQLKTVIEGFLNDGKEDNFSSPNGVYISENGYLYVADTGNYRVVELDKNGNLIQKVKNMVPLLVPLFISAFRRANDLAMAMEARCYHGGDNRTQMKPLKYKKRDHIAYLILFAYLAVAIGFRVAGL